MQITLNQLTAHYQNRSVLRDVSVSFVSGLSYLIGANGSGKTTLLHCLAGLHSFGGKILLDGNPLPQGRGLAQVISLVPQRIELPFRFSVREYVLMGRFPYLNWLGTYQQEDRERAQQALVDLGISGFAERFLQQLSGGELQKVLLARALCQDTPILLLDEPAQSLDPWQQNWLYQQLERLNDGKRLIVCVSHDQAPLTNPGAQIYAIKDGTLLFQQDSPLSQEEIMAVYRPG